MRLLFILLIICSTAQMHAQFTWKRAEFPRKEMTLESIKATHKTHLEKYDNEEALEEIYSWRFTYVSDLIEANAIIYESSLYKYMDYIFDHIVNSNPELKMMDLTYYISNTPGPNAVSLGDGSFIINLGLIRKLHNEGQLAFVLCHEIAHFYLDHSNQSAIERFEKSNSSDYKREVESIGDQEFGKYENMKIMLMKNVYGEMTHSRRQEKEADSIGLYFLSKTAYDPYQSVSCMSLLDSIDRYKYQEKINFNETLSFEDYPFKSRWLEMEMSMFGGQVEYSHWDIDSIKSHPDCETRTAFLKQSLVNTDMKESAKFLQDSLYFTFLKYQSDYEYIDSWIYYDDYGHALFYTLKRDSSFNCVFV